MNVAFAIVYANVSDCGDVGSGIEEWEFANVVFVRPPGRFAGAGVGVEDYEEV